MNDVILLEENRQLAADIHRLEGRESMLAEQHAKVLRRLEKARAELAAYRALPIPQLSKAQSDAFQAAMRRAHQI